MTAIPWSKQRVYQAADPFPRGGIDCRVVSVKVRGLPLVVEYRVECSEEMLGGDDGVMALVPNFAGVSWCALRVYNGEGRLGMIVPFVAGGELLAAIEEVVGGVSDQTGLSG